MSRENYTGNINLADPFDSFRMIFENHRWSTHPFTNHGDDRAYTTEAYHQSHDQQPHFELKGKYHAFDPIREHREAGFFPFRSAAARETDNETYNNRLAFYPRHVFQGPSHYYGKYHPDSDLHNYFIPYST